MPAISVAASGPAINLGGTGKMSWCPDRINACANPAWNSRHRLDLREPDDEGPVGHHLVGKDGRVGAARGKRDNLESAGLSGHHLARLGADGSG